MTTLEDVLYDGFATYASRVDTAIVRRAKRFIERLHRRRGIEPAAARPLRMCVDGTDFRLPTHMVRPTEGSAIQSLVMSFLASSRHFVVFVGPESRSHPWVLEEVAWWLEHRDIGSLRLALTHGETPSDYAANFPAPLVEWGPDLLFFDLRGHRRIRGSRPIEEELLRLAASIHPDNVAPESLIKQWKEAGRQERRRRGVAWGAAGLVASALLGTAGWQARTFQLDSRAAQWSQASRSLTGPPEASDRLAYATAAASLRREPNLVRAMVDAGQQLLPVQSLLYERPDASVTGLGIGAGGSLLGIGTHSGQFTVVDARDGTLHCAITLPGFQEPVLAHPTAPIFAMGTSEGIALVAFDGRQCRAATFLAEQRRSRWLAFDLPRQRLIVVGQAGGVFAIGLEATPTAAFGPAVRLDVADALEMPSLWTLASRSPDHLVASSSDGDVFLLAADTLEVLRGPLRVDKTVFALAAAPSGDVVLGTSEGEVVRIDLDEWRVIDVVRPTPSPEAVASTLGGALTRDPFLSDDSVLAMAVSPHDGSVAVADQGGTVRLLFDAETVAQAVHRGFARAIAFDPLGSSMVTAGDDGRVLRWAIGEPMEFVRVGGVQDAVTQGTTLGLLTAERWHWIPRADVDGRAVLEGSAVASPDRVSAFTSDGRSLVVRGRGRRALQRWDDGSPVAWPELADTDLRGGDVVALRGLARGVAVGARRGHSGWWQFEPRPVWHSAGLDGHVFRLSANDALLAFGSHQGELAIFDRAGTRLTHRNLPNRVSTLALADDRSRWFVGFAGAQGMAGCICDLDAEGTSDAACGEGCIRIATERLVDAHWSPDGSTLALVGYEGLDIRHQDRGWSEGRVRGAPGSDATARSPSGARFATADRDRVLRIRDFETGEVQLALTSFAPPQRLGFVDEHRLMVLDGETLRIWELSVDVLLAKACARWPAHIEPVVLGGVAALPDRTTLCSP